MHSARVPLLMLYYLTAVGLIAHTIFWGLGLAWLSVPREWRRWSWLFSPAFGWALQSAVVWTGAHTALAGTATYARASELLPLGLLVVAFLRGARGRAPGWPALLALAFAGGWLLLSPMAAPGRGLTASSLGSCDHADYAAGARVFQEFSRDDRTGFLGEPEVTRVRSADYFFDFWLRLNHFTPPALLAHNAAVFGVEAYRLVSVTAATLVLLNLPLVLFLARTMIGLKGRGLVGLTALYVLSPLNAYAVHQGAIGQLYAQQGIALLTVALFGASRAVSGGRSGAGFLPLFIAAIWLMAGSYNFILLVCLAPAGTWLLLQLALKRDVRAFGVVCGWLALGGLVCCVLFWGRFAGLAERFSLFAQYDFGWAVPLTSPEGWLGLLRDTDLHGWPRVVRVLLGAAVVVLSFWGVRRLWVWQPVRAFAALALVWPVIAGWAVLAWESRVRANASYDAYKLLAVFLPGLLAGLVSWLGGARPRAAELLLGLILAANVVLAFDFRRQMSTPPLRVDRRLAGLVRLESDSRVASLNLLVDDYWSRLWANAFLLRKPQYFAIHTYEGRLNTALKGEWDLRDTLLRAVPLRDDDVILLNELFHTVRVAASGRLVTRFGRGWYESERSGGTRWRWSGGEGEIFVTNPSPHLVRARLLVRSRALTPGSLRLRLGDQVSDQRPLAGVEQGLIFTELVFPPGETRLTLVGPAAVQPAGSEIRWLSFALHEFELRAVSVE